MYPIIYKLKSGNELIINRAHPVDAEEYCSISNQGFKETRYLSRSSEDEGISLEACKGFIEDVIDSKKETLLVAKYMDQIVGFGDILGCLNRSKMKHKCDLNVFVLKEFWGLGIGSALMKALIDFAYRAGYEKIDLSVADDNERAIKLYERMGFEITGREVHALKHADGDYSDWIMMVKFLK